MYNDSCYNQLISKKKRKLCECNYKATAINLIQLDP